MGAGAAATALMVACGSSTTTSPSSSGKSALSTGAGSSDSSGNLPDGCALLSQPQAAQLSGDPLVARLTGQATANASSCLYADTTGGGGGSATIIIENYPTTVAQSALQNALQRQVQPGKGTVRKISGLADVGVGEVSSDSAAVAFAKSNKLVILVVSSNSRSGSAMEADVEMLAHQVANRV